MDNLAASKLEQRSDDWLAAKLGVFGGTTFKIVQTDGPAYKTLIFEKAAQRIVLAHQSSFSSRYTQWGVDHEDRARARYEFITGREVTQHGIIFSDWSRWVGISPDGLVGAEGGIEIKCPATTREHVRHVIDGPPADYYAQIQGLMLVTGRVWCDFISFDPRLDLMPETVHAATSIQRFERDEAYIADLKMSLEKAVKDVDTIVSQFIKEIGETP